MKEIKLRFDGISPLLLHNNRMADPLDIYKKAMRPLADKKSKKTDAEELELCRIEWEGGLYLDNDGHVCIPGVNIESMLRKAATKTKNGKKIQQGVRVDENSCRLRFPHENVRIANVPKTQDEIPSESLDVLYENYSDRRLVKNGKTTVIRSRPRFDKWSVACTVLYDENIIDERTILEIVNVAAKYEGLGDYRPRYGTFEPFVVGKE